MTPIDEKVTKEIIIPRGMERPPAPDTAQEKGASPRSASDEHDRDRVYGKEAQRRQWDDLEGLVVDVEITSWPSPADNPKGRVVEILGYEDDFGVDVEIIIRKHHLPHQFPVEVLQEAEQFERTIPASELAHRHDYRSLPIVTIDGETARDFDDAVTVRRLANGNFELQVHIADVAHYVTEGSSIDLEARLRGTSVYFPDRAVPMLPMELSTDLCSLRPQVERLVLSCVMEIDHQGEIVGYTLNEGMIRSAERMTYANVNLVLEGDKGLRQHYHQYVDVFELMRELALILNRKRVRRGSIDFDLPEPVIEFDDNGLMKGRDAFGTQHRASADRGVHAGGQRVRGQLPGEEAGRFAVSHSRKARSQARLRFRDHRRDIRIFARRGSIAGEARAVQVGPARESSRRSVRQGRSSCPRRCTSRRACIRS